MDGRINEPGSLRSINVSKANKSSQKSFQKSPKDKNLFYKSLRIKNDTLIQIWRIVFLSSISVSLGFVLIRNGFSPIDSGQIKIKGSETITPSEIIKASYPQLPRPLLELNPQKLKIQLMKGLPIKSVSIRRHLIPPSIEIELLERNPIAFAHKEGDTGKVLGMLDESGHWMPLTIANKVKRTNSPLFIEGWEPNLQEEIAILLKNRKKLGSTLEKILISPNGELSLQTEDFPLIYLGANKRNLEEKIKTLHHLIKNLPPEFFLNKKTTIDIRDPSKPELIKKASRMEQK